MTAREKELLNLENRVEVLERMIDDPDSMVPILRDLIDDWRRLREENAQLRDFKANALIFGFSVTRPLSLNR